MAFSRYTLRQLEAFATVADTLSFSGCADRLGLTPSAVSQLVNELETSVGFKLFERSTRRVALTASGREFLGSAAVVLKNLRLAESAAADLRNRAAGLVRVAAPMVIASSILPDAVRQYGQLRPKVVVRIRDASVEQLVDMVADGEVDFAVGPDRPTGDDVERLSLFESPWVLWCAPDHPLAAKRRVRWRDLRAHALVTAGRDHERSVAQMRLGLPEDERITPIDVVDNVSTSLGIAAAGLAATLSPAYVGVWAEQRWGLVMRRVVEPEVMRHVCLYKPTRRVTSPAAEGFAEALYQSLRAGRGAEKEQGVAARGRSVT
ncbi:MAG: LysR substrate-binding domain-containing protein [Variovorax sp.]